MDGDSSCTSGFTKQGYLVIIMRIIMIIIMVIMMIMASNSMRIFIISHFWILKESD